VTGCVQAYRQPDAGPGRNRWPPPKAEVPRCVTWCGIAVIFPDLLIIPVISKLANTPACSSAVNFYQRGNPRAARVSSVSNWHVPLRRVARRRGSGTGFSVHGRVRDVREKSRRDTAECGWDFLQGQISPLDGDITLESSTNVAFPWNGSFPARRPVSSQARQVSLKYLRPTLRRHGRRRFCLSRVDVSASNKFEQSGPKVTRTTRSSRRRGRRVWHCRGFESRAEPIFA